MNEEILDQGMAEGPEQVEMEAAEETVEAEQAVEDTTPEYKRIKHKVKEGGQEIEVDYDTLVSGYQKAQAGDRKLKEAAEMRRQADHVLTQLKSLQQDPSQLLNIVGEEQFINLAEQMLYKKYSREEMSPEQRELEELREFRAQQERARKEAEQKENMTRQEKQIEEYRESFQKRFDTILDNMGWPKTPETVARMARYYQAASEQGIEPSDRDVQQFLEKNYSSELKGIFSKVSVDKLHQMIGEDGLKALRSYDLQKIKNPKAKSSGSQQGGQSRGKARSLEEAMAEAWKRAGF